MRVLRHFLTVVIAAAGALLTAQELGAHPSGDSDRQVKRGGIFRVVTAGIDSIDPEITYGPATPYLDASCALLLRGAATPEVAANQPTVTDGGKTYTFNLRKTFRFNTGTRVTATSFAHALDRALTPAMQSPGAQLFGDIVGADEVAAGKASHASGIQARGYRLTIHLTHPVPDFAARLTVTSACAVPSGLPAVPEAVTAPLSGAGPYYIAEYVPGRKLVLRRNRFYRGTRPHRVDSVVVTVVDSDQTALEALTRGTADWGDIGDPSLVTTLGASARARLRVLTSPGKRCPVRSHEHVAASVREQRPPSTRGQFRHRPSSAAACPRRLNDRQGDRSLSALRISGIQTCRPLSPRAS